MCGLVVILRKSLYRHTFSSTFYIDNTLLQSTSRESSIKNPSTADFQTTITSAKFAGYGDRHKIVYGVRPYTPTILTRGRGHCYPQHEGYFAGSQNPLRGISVNYKYLRDAILRKVSYKLKSKIIYTGGRKVV